MQTRDLVILIVIAGVAAGVGLVIGADDSLANEALAPPGIMDPAAREATDEPDEDGPATPDLAQSQANPRAMQQPEPPRVDTTGWTKGIVRGDILLAASVLDKLDTVNIIVKEQRAAIDRAGNFHEVRQYIVPVERSIGTPTFEVRDIEFSKYPYKVSVYAAGLNGSARTVMINEKTPLHDDIQLRITPGRPYSILLRDQDYNPYPDTTVRLIPVGDPQGRKDYTGTTDGYGSIAFEQVLAGDYRIWAGQQGMALAEPELVTVQSEARVYGNKIQGQGHTYVIQRGMPLDVRITDRGGYAIANASVRLQASDRTRAKPIDRATDGSGLLHYPHLLPGKWMITVTKQNYQPWTRQVTIEDGQLHEPVNAQLTRLR